MSLSHVLSPLLQDDPAKSGSTDHADEAADSIPENVRPSISLYLLHQLLEGKSRECGFLLPKPTFPYTHHVFLAFFKGAFRHPMSTAIRLRLSSRTGRTTGREWAMKTRITSSRRLPKTPCRARCSSWARLR